jgi:hypothetical protein
MGVPDNGNDHGYSTWDSSRIYTLGAVTPALASQPKAIALTDSGTSPDGGAASVTRFRNHLLSFYGKTGTPSLHANIETHIAMDNEIDRNTGLNMTALANTHELMEAMLLDFPKASLWIDLTAFNLRQGTSEQYLMAQATSGRRLYQMVELAGSFYPPGRNDYPAMTLSSYTDPAFVIDPYIAKALEKGFTKLSIWEFGIPMLWDDPIGWPNAGNLIQNNTKRRDYVQQFMYYFFDTCLANGITPVMAQYWDQQSGANKGTPSNTAPDNRLVNDNTRANPSTATAWRNMVTNYNSL